MSLREAVDTAVAGREVPGPVLESAFGEIMAGKSSDALIAALLVALHMKGETVGEIVAAARALRAVATTVPGVDPRTLDTCGTGGDGRHGRAECGSRNWMGAGTSRFRIRRFR